MKRRKPGLNASGRAVGGSHGDAPLSDKCHQIIVKDKRRTVLSIGATESPKMRGLPEENGYFYLYAFLCRTGLFAGLLAFFRGGSYSSAPRISPAPEFSRPSLYGSLGPATKTQNVTHRSCQWHLKIFPRLFRGESSYSGSDKARREMPPSHKMWVNPPNPAACMKKTSILLL